MTITDAQKKEGSSPRVLTVRKRKRRKGDRRENMGAGIRAKGARERDRGCIQTLIRDSIIELSQGGRFRLHFQLFAGKRSANTAYSVLSIMRASPRISDTELSASTSARTFRFPVTSSSSFLFSFPLFYPSFSVSRVRSHRRNISRTPRGHMIRCRFLNCLIPPV